MSKNYPSEYLKKVRRNIAEYSIHANSPLWLFFVSVHTHLCMCLQCARLPYAHLPMCMFAVVTRTPGKLALLTIVARHLEP